MWWGDVAHDQRGTDAFSLVYDSEPARGRPRDPRPAARDPDGRRRRDARQLVRAPLRRRAGRHGDAGRGRRHERHAPRIGARTRRRSCPASRSSSTSKCISRRGCSRRATASGSRSTTRMWPMLWPTPEPMTTELRLGSSRLDAAGRALREAPGAGFPAAREGPGVRRLSSRSRAARPRATARSPPSTATRRPAPWSRRRPTAPARAIPWGTEQSFETIRYEINDDAPADAQRDRHASHGSRAARPHAGLGRGVDVSAATAKISSTVTAGG